MTEFQLGQVLDQLIPMHLCLNVSGDITHAGPTLMKLRPKGELIGKPFLDVFRLRRPAGVKHVSELFNLVGQKLYLRFRSEPATSFKGQIVKTCDERVLLNLSFGISVLDCVREYGLTIADFAPTDLTVEMLYLVEAKTAVMNELRKLNNRLQSAKTVAEEQALSDTLTGLKNRRAMDHILARKIEANRRFGLMHLDLDFFKDVNDTYGHAAGDHVLQEVANVLVAETRLDDTVARVGGDEFVVLFPDMTDAAKLKILAQRIIEKLERPITFNGALCRISASIGATTSENYESLNAEKILADADFALYASKSKGRAQVTFFSETLMGEDRSAEQMKQKGLRPHH